MAFDKYRHYFDIDPDYFPAVNEAVINNNPDMWKKYYPHATFIKLVKDTVNVLRKEQKRSIWVEGAYGTGKSHAVLTLKKLLDASEEETKEYFEKFQMDNDLFNKLQGAKNSGEILTVHRYGSSSIRGDHNLVFAIQESIEKAFKDKGIENKGNSALKGAIIKWLEDSANKNYFNSLVTGEYSNLFGGDNADDILEKLNTLSGDALIALMDKIFKVADERQIKVLSLDTTGLVAWIKEIIKANNLKAIVFIWDEFTEFFNNNTRSLTGFQEIAEISETDPFYLIIVTHKSAGLFDDADKDKSKILDRFIKPTCIIELPENMAFQLMGAAMEKNQDETVLDDWEMTVDDLYDRTYDSRKIVKASANISDKELKDILPIHPYTALLLKHISSAFDSNQRSMFDFIKNDRGDEIKGFQWFIDNYGPDDDNPLLTIDMLWEFFYEKGKEYLSHDIRSILDCYSRAATKQLSNEEKKVLQTVLLLQAISQKVGDSVELFIPNEKNINNAFEGSDMDSGAAGRCAEKLVRDEILYKKPLGGGKTQYSALVNAGDMAAIEKFKEEVKKKTTSTLVNEGQVSEAVTLGGALKLRYEMRYVSSSDFDSTIKLLRNQESNYINKIVAVVSFAKDDSESVVLGKKIKNALKDGSYKMIFVDASTTPLGKDGYEQYCENMAQAMYHQGKDNNLARQYETNAKEALKKWKNRISGGEFIVYTSEKQDGERATTIEMLYSTLSDINKTKYKNCLEGTYNVTDNMYMPSSLKQGVACGVKQEVQGTFKSANPATKLENALGEAWKYEGKYWVDKPHLLISKIKISVEKIIKDAFDNGGRISIARIYDELKAEPFGFMPCNLSAFVLGFVLKEYVDGTFSWSDGLTNDVLSINKLQEMVDEIIKLQITPNPRYKDKYIVAMTEDEKAFNEATSIAFEISKSLCTSIEQTRERIRSKMKEYTFPIWTIKSIISDVETQTNKDILIKILDYYCGIANSNNMGAGSTSDNDIAYAIGKLCIENKEAANDLKILLNKEKCTEGMKAYLKEFDNGELITLAEKAGDSGQYINILRKKFDADAANWVWNVETAQQKIREVILEYKIIVESNKVISKSTTFENTVREWCDKCQYIRISYPAAKNYLDGFSAFLEVLYNVKKSGVILDSQKQKFYDLLIANADNFRTLYGNQIDLFKKVCEFYLEGFTDEEIKEIYNTIPTGSFTKDKTEYTNIINNKVEEYKRNSKSAKLKKIWKEKTNTDTPREWSKKYKMPILCMVEDKEIQIAKAAFGAVNKAHPDEASIDKAIAYFSTATFFTKLDDENARNKAFVDSIIKNYDVMLTNLDEVKQYLDSRITADAYDWFGLPEVEKKLRQMAEAKYNQGGCDKALEKIDNMILEDVKRYLKDLIKDDMIVGMAIIKDN